jgi:hypothetical protein
MPRVNLDGIEGGFEVLPKGIYEVAVTEAEIKTAQSSGEDYMNLTLTIQSGDFAGRKLWAIISFSAKAAFKVKEFLVATAYDIPKGDFSLEPENVYGLECYVKVDIEEYEGTEKNRVNQFIPFKKK